MLQDNNAFIQCQQYIFSSLATQTFFQGYFIKKNLYRTERKQKTQMQVNDKQLEAKLTKNIIK